MRPSAGFIKFNRKGKKLSAELIEKKFWKRKTELPTGQIGLYDRYFIARKKEKIHENSSTFGDRYEDDRYLRKKLLPLNLPPP